jgi:hypothetical protein
MPDYQRYRRRPRPSTKALTAKLVALGVAATLAYICAAYWPRLGAML